MAAAIDAIRPVDDHRRRPLARLRARPRPWRLATHELPTLGPRAPETPLPSPTVFSIEPGIYLEGETGVWIEDPGGPDAQAGRLEVITKFPSSVVVVGS
jgi:hypothetical protein